jgi:mono/diheme cytochrome c family protein
MSYKAILVLISLFAIMPFAQASEGGKLFTSICMGCHTANEHLNFAAPSVHTIKSRVLQAYPRREDFINRIVQWVQRPDASRALIPEAVKRYGLMPALPYSEQQLRSIAEYLYDTEVTSSGWHLEELGEVE